MINTEKITSTFRAFHNRNYSLFFSGQSLSQIGNWIQRTGVSWVVYTMTHSAFMLGLTVFVSQLHSDKAMRGRVRSYVAIAYFGLLFRIFKGWPTEI
jgi:hypothetical protein